MATSVVHRVTVFDADDIDTALAALTAAAPAAGSNFDAATLKALGGFCIGSRDRGDDADIDSENVVPTTIHEGVTVRPPGSLTGQRYITRHAGIETVEFTAYDVAQEVFELDSNVETDGVACARGATQTNRALIIEYDGIRFDCYPDVVLHITAEEGGYGEDSDDAVNKYAFTARVLGTADVPSGQVKVHYVAET